MSHLDLDDLLDTHRAEHLQENGDADHLSAEFVSEQGHDVLRVQVQHREEQRDREQHQHDTADTAFAREGLNLSQDAEPLADDMADLVEDFGQVAAALPLNNDCLLYTSDAADE